MSEGSELAELAELQVHNTGVVVWSGVRDRYSRGLTARCAPGGIGLPSCAMLCSLVAGGGGALGV